MRKYAEWGKEVSTRNCLHCKASLNIVYCEKVHNLNWLDGTPFLDYKAVIYRGRLYKACVGCEDFNNMGEK